MDREQWEFWAPTLPCIAPSLSQDWNSSEEWQLYDTDGKVRRWGLPPRKSLNQTKNNNQSCHHKPRYTTSYLVTDMKIHISCWWDNLKGSQNCSKQPIPESPLNVRKLSTYVAAREMSFTYTLLPYPCICWILQTSSYRAQDTCRTRMTPPVIFPFISQQV